MKRKPSTSKQIDRHAVPAKIRGKRLLLRGGVGLMCVVLGVVIAQPVQRGLAGLKLRQNAAAAPHPDGGPGVGGVTLYQSGMHPWIITTQPGNCPICGMKLELIDPSKLTGAVEIDPVVVQNLGIRTAPVTRGPVTQTLRTVGTVEVAEPNLGDINLRVSGWIEALHVGFVGAAVEAGQPLFSVYSPELYAAQEEFLLARREAPGTHALATVTRDRLLGFGLTPSQIDALAERGESQRNVDILSPFAGVVLDKHANAGMAFTPGMRAFRIADLSDVWVQAALYESQLPFAQAGLSAEMQVAAFPGEVFDGQVAFADPVVDPQTRTANVRLAFANPDGRLRPGMFADVTFKHTLRASATLAPLDAVIDTGSRRVAFVALGQGRFEPREVLVGNESENAAVEILAGLTPGETVVTSGQFLLDSEANVRAALARLAGGQAPDRPTPKITRATPPPPADTHASTSVSTPAPDPARPLPAGPAASPQITIQPHLDALVGAYLDLQNKLTRNDFDGVTELAAAVQEAAAQAAARAPDGQRPLLSAVRDAARQAAQATDVPGLRAAFGVLSDAAIALVSAAPPTADVADVLRVTHCPMVNRNWLQMEKGVRNPYDPGMLACGVFRATVPTLTPEPSDAP